MSQDRIEIYENKHTGLAFSFWVNPKTCGNNEHYEDYIRYIAIQDHLSGQGVTYAYIRNIDEKDILLGYITLRATSYIKDF